MQQRLAALLSAGSVVLAGLSWTPHADGAAVRDAAAAVPVVRAAPTYTPPRIHWRPCRPADDPDLAALHAQCGRLVVPLDYDHPRARKISLAVSRVRHRSSAADFQGIMLTNPGGPGGAGLWMSLIGSGPAIPGKADNTYDWIGFDPRGVGHSRPALSCDGSYTHYDRPNYVATTQRLERIWLRRARGYAHDCATAPARRLLEHVKTTDTVADMDSLRRALGRQKLNFYAFSYGTYLGQVYATLHPDRVRRFVLDSNVDPRGVWYQANIDQDIAFERNIGIFFEWLAKYDEVYHLGSDPAEVRQGYTRVLRRLDRHPAGGVIGPDELADVLLFAGYSVTLWEDLAGAYAALVNHGRAKGIKSFYDVFYPQGPGADNQYAMYLATECTDVRWPQSWERMRRDTLRVAEIAPFFTWGNAWFNAPCLFWPARPGHLVPVDGSQVTAPVLLIDETLDAATPFEGSLEVRQRFPTASLIEGVDGTTHGASLSGVRCVDKAVAAYLATGALPPRQSGRQSDLQCPAIPQPDPTSDQARRSPSRGDGDALRVLLSEAPPAFGG
jgi:pimeloyl-ACP methyl ester carboxylesterase